LYLAFAMADGRPPSGSASAPPLFYVSPKKTTNRGLATIYNHPPKQARSFAPPFYTQFVFDENFVRAQSSAQCTAHSGTASVTTAAGRSSRAEAEGGHAEGASPSKKKKKKTRDKKATQAKNNRPTSLLFFWRVRPYARRLWTCHRMWAPAAGCGVFLYDLAPSGDPFISCLCETTLRPLFFNGHFFFLRKIN
jgi:hypothetical protein